ncbi:MAG TPA: Ig-like domain-containing protein [Gemmatimonadaceae bacterium]|nr:Ig-like domain-containing protein [Gemmatimonadaceae bacterium]
MPPIIQGARKNFHHISKGLAVAASTGAALVSIITALFSYGVLGKSESHQSIGNLGAAWVRLRPTIDTAFAIGDTIHFAATIADKNGSILVGARPVWTSGDSTVAVVGADGSVVARGPGSTTVQVVVGTLVANARVMVKQLVAGVAVVNPAGDTAISLLEEAQLQLQARAYDARGHTVPGRAAVWHIDDTTVATLDSNGMLTGRSAGRTVVSAKIEGQSGYLPVSVMMIAARLDAVAGTNQRALVGHALSQRIVVRAVNRKGGPAAGKIVSFRLADSQGKVDPATGVTDADGRARTTWTLGADPGRQVLLATVESLDSTLTIDAEADPVAANTRLVALADTVRARAGVLLTDSIGIRVTDSAGRALPNLPVRWSAIDGTIETDSGPARTDSLGISRARWRLGGRSGPQRLQAFVGGSASKIAPVTLIATALSGAPATVSAVSGDRQLTAAGSALPKPIVLRVVDSTGNGTADVPVILSLSAGTVPDTALVTDSLGYARTRWTMGRSAGEYSLAVHVDGIKQLLKLEARATPAAPANLSFDDAPPASPASRTARPRAKKLVALVTDIYGNPVPDAPVTLSVKSGTVAPARAVTDTKGRVALTWTLGTIAGDQSLNGVVRGTDVKGAYVFQVLQSGAPRPLVEKPKRKSP